MPPKGNSKPKFISIQGNIGSGKSTILRIIREHFPQLTILDEPLAEWQHIGEEGKINLLELYYHQPKRWGFTFQIYAFMSRLNKWISYSKEEGQGLRISQRSLLSDRYIFASIMRDLAFLDEAEHEIYLQFYNHLIEMNQVVDLFGVIYVQCPPEICQQRIKKRSREGEEEISLDYLQKIHEKHEGWLNKEQNQHYSLIIDNTKPIETAYLIKLISDWLQAKDQAEQEKEQMELRGQSVGVEDTVEEIV